MYGSFYKTLAQWQAATLSTYQMTISAASVIQMRVMQMSTGTMKPEEAARMVLEKPPVFLHATEMSARALFSNKGLAAAALAGIAPIRKATRANARRLSARPPRPLRRRG
ncbi:hypothetical protein KM176_15310 [Pseudooceanicola sp. CBS1P-1]|uniref:Antifreeze protein n=1 Tax=Pseudooceanicola albus TaxID=2692189 RepID=A0A6L7G563_9RHOB|nr:MULTISPECIES: hypothetical protein [Pseudooceanicola]MBT9385239.1 hypothetical protein [Pseudooceanicola endophyticus]MXN18677.1 hypothetical protein [Pseudooceanicola albus]